MNRLLNIKRTGGYPVDAEVIELLYNQRLYIEALFGALELPAGSVVFLEANEDFSLINEKYGLVGSYVYVVPHFNPLISQVHSGKIKGNLYYLKGDSSVSISDLLNGTAAKRGLKINEMKYSTTDEHNVVYADYMSVVEAELIADDNPYTFYKLSDVIEMGKWTYLDINNVHLWDVNVAFHALHSNFIKRNATKVIIQLGVKYITTIGIDYNSTVDITFVPTGFNLSNGVVYPLLCMLRTATVGIHNVPCVLYHSGASIKIQLKLNGLGAIMPDDVFEIKGELFL